MLSYVVAGLVLGGIYAISAAGLVVTYVSSGILNFAFASIAYFIARFYYFLNSEHGWSIAAAAVVSLVIAAPLLGVLLWAVLFRYLRLAPQLIKIVATIGLSVALPAIAVVVFGNAEILAAPGLAPIPVHVFRVLGTSVTLDQLIVYISVIVVLVAGWLILRLTEVGLSVRAMVDSEAMTSLSGTNPSIVSLGVWAVTTFLAGLAGVLLAPIIGLDANGYALLIAAAFAAVIAGRLRNLPVAIATALLMGIVGALLQWRLPLDSPITNAINQSIPFFFIAVVLLYSAVRGGFVSEGEELGGTLDRAIRPHGVVFGARRVVDLADPDAAPSSSAWSWLHPRRSGPIASVGIMLILLATLSSLWQGDVGEAAAYAVAFLGVTIVTGQGGMIWLCQITFAAVGAITVGQLAGVHGWPVIPALIAGAVIASAMGVIIGALTIRLGDLYVALVTLTFALLMDNLVFRRDVFYQFGAGVAVPRPAIAGSTTAFSLFALATFCLLALFIVNIRRSSIGLALAAVRSSSPASRTIGLSVATTKLFAAGAGAFVAALGGGLLACYAQEAIPDSYVTLGGLTWLAVLVTIGARTNTAALVAGASFAFIPALFIAYLPTSIALLPTVLFGLGAVLVARDPDGVLSTYARGVDRILGRAGRSKQTPQRDQSTPAQGATPS